MFNHMTGATIIHVPYKGGALAVNALVAGEVQMTIADAGTIAAQLKAGRVRALGVTSAKRASAMPELPSLAESGVRGYAVGSWFGLFAPAQTPVAIVSKLNTETQRILNLPDIRERLVALGGEPASGSPEQFAAQIQDEITRFRAVAKAANMKFE